MVKDYFTLLNKTHHKMIKDYFTLLNKTHQVTMEVKHMRSLCIEIYKTQNGLNPKYINDSFARNRSDYFPRRPYDLITPRTNQTTFSFYIKSIRYEGMKLWNHLLNLITVFPLLNAALS